MNDRLRVAFYTDSSEVGGAERSLAHLVAAVDPRINAAVVGVDPLVVEEIAAGRPGARPVILPFISSRYDLKAIFAHLRMLAGFRPQVFHANLISPWVCQLAVFLAVAAPRVRVVAVEQLPTQPPSEQQRRLKRLTARRLDAHVAVGERSARDIERIVGLPAGSVRTIHNGVPDLGAPNRDSSPSASNPITVGAVGRVERQKGFDVLIRALPDVAEAHVVVVGEGTERLSLQRLAGELGVADRVSWVGWSATARDHLSSFDVFVLPSRYEGFPLTVLEAMLAELPVVASDVGSVREAVIDGETGLLVPPDDPAALSTAVGRLAADAESRRTLGVRGRGLVLGRYTAAAMARRFEDLYDEITA